MAAPRASNFSDPESKTNEETKRVDGISDNGKRDAINYDDVANKLLKDNFLLTALELHTELIELGRDSHNLRDYFSNPSNFERGTSLKHDIVSNLERTSSVTTFDSLDFARYSDDGDKQVDEQVAVLEFELRKAKETIKSLRANLTEAAESDAVAPDRGKSPRKESIADVDQPLKSHELRALNFLVNEHLFKQNYKLTSITFSDENENQDFEDWDDVGLNICKPPDLIHIYRDYGKHHTISADNQCDVFVQTDNFSLEEHCPQVDENELSMKEKLHSLEEENQKLVERIKNVERDLENVLAQQIRSSTPIVTPINTPRKSQAVAPFKVSNSNIDQVSKSSELTSEGGESSFTNIDISIPFQSASKPCTSSLNVELDSVVDPAILSERLDDSLTATQRNIPEIYLKNLENICFHRKQVEDARLSSEVSQIVDTPEKLVLMLARCLPHIIPNVILAKREELIPVILGTISLHPDADERDKLLNLLFNLIKRPEYDQRQVILSGFVSIARHLGPTRMESELLPQCWEQLSHKYMERRLLVAESCGVLAPHIPVAIRNSLVISMLQQILMEEKVEEVQVAAVRSLTIVFSYIDDEDKITQALGLIMQGLMEDSESVVDAIMSTFLPVIALWLVQLGRLEDSLIMYLLDRFIDIIMTRQQTASSLSISSVMPLPDEQNVLIMLKSLQSSIPYLFVSIVASGPYFEDRLQSSPPIIEFHRFPQVSDNPLHDPSVIYGDKPKFENLMALYDDYVNQEWYKSWDQLDWLHKKFIPDIIKLLCSSQLSSFQNVVPSFIALLSDICQAFGPSYTANKIIPLFQQSLNVAEHDLGQVQSGNTALTQLIVPVYAGGVLAVFSQEENRSELKKFLLTTLTTLTLCNTPITNLQITFSQLSGTRILHDLLLSVLWDGLVHTSAHVRASSAKLFQLLITVVNQTLLANRVIPALVTFATDSDMSVRTAVVEAFGIVLQTATNYEILDKVKMQFQTFLDDAILRDHHPLHVQLINTFANMTPNLEPAFREEFILPRLAMMASRNGNSANETRQTDVALALLEAYTALSCCSFRGDVIRQSILPALQCLLNDIRTVAPEHEIAITSMIKEFEIKAEISKPSERSGAVASSLHQLSTSGMEDVKNKMTKYFSQHKPTGRPNISNIFQLKKK